GAAARTPASELPQKLVATAMIHAISGGLEEYPKAGVRDHHQYRASSGNRSTTENLSATNLAIVSAPTAPANSQNVFADLSLMLLSVRERSISSSVIPKIFQR